MFRCLTITAKEKKELKKCKKYRTAWNDEYCLWYRSTIISSTDCTALCKVAFVFSVCHVCTVIFSASSLITDLLSGVDRELPVIKSFCAILLALEIILFSCSYVSVHCCCLEYIVMLFSRWRCNKVSSSLDMYTAL